MAGHNDEEKYSELDMEALLSDPVRSQMYLELSLHKDGLSIRELAHYTGKDRTTINFHANKFLEQGVIVENEKRRTEYKKGRPTKYYMLNENLLREYRIAQQHRGKHYGMLQFLQKLSSNLQAFSNIANVSKTWIEENEEEAVDMMEDSPTAEFLVALSEREAQIFFKHFSEAMEKAYVEALGGKPEEPEEQRYLFFSGIIPVLRDPFNKKG